MTERPVNESDKHPEALPGPPIKIQPLILHYRVLRTSLFFTLIWLFMAFLSLLFTQIFHYAPPSIEFFILVLAAVVCLILAIHNLGIYGGPFLTFTEDRLKVRHSIVRRITIPYGDIVTVNVAAEEIELIRKSGHSVILNLAHLSFEDQAVCLEKLAQLQSLSTKE